MRKLLFLSYYFPPQACAASQRSRKLAKYLHEYGWEPVVITVENNPSLPSDPTLLDDIPHVRQIRIPFNDFTRAIIKQKALRLLLNKLLVPDYERLWLPYVRSVIDGILQKERMDAIYTSCSPFSLNLEGERLQKKYSLPWVTDFRDGWTLGTVFEPGTRLHKPAHLRMEARALENCDMWIANTPGLLEEECRQYPFLRGKSLCISNGFDSKDFVDVRPAPVDSSNWNLVYAGAWYRRYYPDALFKIIAAFRLAYPQVKLSLHYLGPHFQFFSSLASRHGLKTMLVHHGYPHYRDAIPFLKSADLLLMTLPSDPRARYWVPAKLYEYLASGAPIFGVCPKGDAFNLVAKHGTALDINGEDLLKTGVQNLHHLWNQWNTHTQTPIQPALLNEFEYSNLAQRLASVLDRVAAISR